MTRALARIYARPEFRERTTPPSLRWLSHVRDVVAGWVQSILLRILESEHARPFLFWFVVAWLVVALVVAVVHVSRAFLLRLRGRTRSSAGQPDRAPPAGPRAEDRGPEAWEAAAGEAAAAGRLREAALALYHAVLLRLDRRGAVRFQAAKTPGDYRREASRDPDLGGRFEAFLRVFLPIAFGSAPRAEGWRSLRAAADRVLERA